MLARAHRLTRGQDFSEAIRRGRRAGTSMVVLHVLVRRDDPSEPRVGLVVSKGVGNAVTRNRVKRRLRHVAGERLGMLPSGALLVIRALPPAAHGSSAALARDVDGALRRLLDAYA